jgi:DNA-binding HxlR family transcriptional regulator
MMIIFHLFDRGVLRFSELEKAIPAVSQKMLIQQLRELEREGVISRTLYPEVPPKVECDLTEWGKAACPALDALLEWTALRPKHGGPKHGGPKHGGPKRLRPYAGGPSS